MQNLFRTLCYIYISKTFSIVSHCAIQISTDTVRLLNRRNVTKATSRMKRHSPIQISTDAKCDFMTKTTSRMKRHSPNQISTDAKCDCTIQFSTGRNVTKNHIAYEIWRTIVHSKNPFSLKHLSISLAFFFVQMTSASFFQSTPFQTNP